MRVKSEELEELMRKVVSKGRRYASADLEGAVVDGDHALEQAGFRVIKITKTGELRRMVVYRCRPDWSPVAEDEVVRRLEGAWVTDAAFMHEAHSVAIRGELVYLDFVTWWDSGAFSTGRIEVALDPSG
jgi:hypothetical protein